MTLYLIAESNAARQFSRRKAGTPKFWVPRSVIKSITQFTPVEGEYRRCEVEIEDWFVKKMDEPKPKETQKEFGI